MSEPGKRERRKHISSVPWIVKRRRGKADSCHSVELGDEGWGFSGGREGVSCDLSFFCLTTVSGALRSDQQVEDTD